MGMDIFTSISGFRVTSTEVWERTRKREIYALFENLVYGAAPIGRPDDMEFSVEEIHREHSILQKKITITFMGYTMGADMFLPEGNTQKLPAFLMNMHEYEIGLCDIDKELDFEIVPILDIVDRGYAAVIMKTTCICQDYWRQGRYKTGIFDLVKHTGKDNYWSIIASWAWGLSRVMDYLETDKDIDKDKVIVIGHSRSGKTALWAGASDPRFAMVVSNDSGCTGAAYTRGKKGEHIKDINDAAGWFCENYKMYNEDENMLPVDQHMLLALIAPRPLYVARSSLDEWADPGAERASCRMASHAYMLYGLKGAILPAEDKIETDVPYHEGMIGYHCKTGEHSITKFDWKCFMDFADKRVE